MKDIEQRKAELREKISQTSFSNLDFNESIEVRKMFSEALEIIDLMAEREKTAVDRVCELLTKKQSLKEEVESLKEKNEELCKDLTKAYDQQENRRLKDIKRCKDLDGLNENIKRLNSRNPMTNKAKSNLARALGLIQGCLHIKDMEEFDKAGLVKNLEEVEKLLTEIMENEDGK